MAKVHVIARFVANVKERKTTQSAASGHVDSYSRRIGM
jgi:hypothetical protein